MRNRFFTLLPALLAVVVLSGCGTNPVTGKREFQFVGEASEIRMGQQSYLPARQMQGGDYVLDPELTQYVRSVGERLARVSDRPDLPYEFVVLNNSVPNAWAMPGGKIAFNRGLLTEMQSEAELAAVMGHEIVHAAARHGAKNVERGMLLQAGMLAVQVSQIDNEYGGLVVGAANIGAQLISQKYGRNAELESDLYGMEYMHKAGYDPSAAVDLQQTFVRLSEASGRKTDWLSGLFASHPPSQFRVDKNRETLAALGAGGDYGRERYKQMIAPLIRNKPAYEAYDEGVKALRAGDAGKAARLAQQAINYYQTAIERNPNYFEPYLGRGIAHRARGEFGMAQRDFQKSISLLPTATAYHGLGMIALNNGDRANAVKFLEQAAQSNSPVGTEARGTLAQIQPERFIATRVGTDAEGRVVVQVQNQATMAMGNVQLEVQVLDPTGRQIQSRKTVGVRDWIGAGQATVIATGLGPIQDRAQLQRVQVVVRGATPQTQ
jgi:predicted Zn-dependent protease